MSTDARSLSTTVALVACPDYEADTVRKATQRCLDLLGGIDTMLPSKDGRVLLKPNILVGMKPERAVTTHPQVVSALAELVVNAGGTTVIGDSPMFAKLESALKRSGYAEVLEQEGVGLAQMEKTTVINVVGQGAHRFKRFEVAKVIDEVDLLVNVCKLKTHGITGLTIAIKNLFGVIPGLEKSKWHIKAPGHQQMASMLVDLYEALHNHLAQNGRCRELHFCDAVLALEGEGPSASGKPRHIGALAASFDPVALDAVMAQLVSFDVDAVLTTTIAAQRGLGCGDIEAIHIVGDALTDLRVEQFEPCRRSFRVVAPTPTGWPLNNKFIRNRIVEKPLIDREACTGCGDCAKVCAAEAITLVGKPQKASIDLSRCIRCYCCSEACRYSAARLGPRPLLAKIVDLCTAVPLA